MINVAAATTAELVEFYNKYSGKKPIKKFQDRATAERRVAELRDAKKAEDEPLIEQYGFAYCPHCGIHLANGVQDYDSMEDHAKQENDPSCKISHEFLCLGCGEEFGAVIEEKEKPAANELRSEAVAETWKDPEVKAKRSQRHKVRVDGKEYRSVRAAFLAFGLPMAKHIKFRMELKAEGQLNAFGHHWEVIEA